MQRLSLLICFALIVVVKQACAQSNTVDACAICGTWRPVDYFSVLPAKPRSHPDELLISQFVSEKRCFPCEESRYIKARLIYDVSGVGMTTTTYEVGHGGEKIPLAHDKINKDFFEWFVKDSVVKILKDGNEYSYRILEVTNEFMVRLDEQSITVFVKQGMNMEKLVLFDDKYYIIKYIEKCIALGLLPYKLNKVD